jgi:hypothetical protein
MRPFVILPIHIGLHARSEPTGDVMMTQEIRRQQINIMWQSGQFLNN